MKKIFLVISLTIMFMLIGFITINFSYVTAVQVQTPDKILGEMKTEGNATNYVADADVTKTTQTIMATAINVIRVVGTGIAIIMMTYVAIKYMSAAPNEKAEYKKSATAMVVGAIVLFAATNILSIISKFATTNIT